MVGRDARLSPSLRMRQIAQTCGGELYATFIAPFHLIVSKAAWGYAMMRTTGFSATLPMLPNPDRLRIEAVTRAPVLLVGRRYSLKHLLSRYPAALMIGDDPLSPQLWPVLVYAWATRGRKQDVAYSLYLNEVGESPYVAEPRWYTFELVMKFVELHEDDEDKHATQEFLTILTPALDFVQLLSIQTLPNHFHLPITSIYQSSRSLRLSRAREYKLRRMTCEFIKEHKHVFAVQRGEKVQSDA
ncbi:MAG: hypothetical protein ACK4JD_10880 [Thermoflexales bacterium]